MNLRIEVYIETQTGYKVYKVLLNVLHPVIVDIYKQNYIVIRCFDSPALSIILFGASQGQVWSSSNIKTLYILIFFDDFGEFEGLIIVYIYLF